MRSLYAGVISSFFPFPPVALILKVMQKIKNDQAQGILIAPHSLSQPWYPLWSNMIIGEPIIFYPNDELLLSICRTVRHPLVSNMRLVAGMLSGRLTEDNDLMTKRST